MVPKMFEPLKFDCNSKIIKKQELWFLRSARRLMLIDIYMKFREDSLIGFQVIEQTQFCDRVQGK